MRYRVLVRSVLLFVAIGSGADPGALAEPGSGPPRGGESTGAEQPDGGQERDLELAARRVEGGLMAPCCMGNTVAEHYSPASFKMRDDIRKMLAAGRSEKEILEFYVAQYGVQILAAPTPQGFNLIAYLLPSLLLLVGAGALVIYARRWSSRPTSESSTPRLSEIDPEYTERLRRQLQQFD